MDAVCAAKLQDERTLVRRLVGITSLTLLERAMISGAATDLVTSVRASGEVGVMESFLQEYGLSTKEGVALLCLAEAMLRVPDARTVDALIEDKITAHEWAAHLGDSASVLINASTWALMITGRLLDSGDVGGVLRNLVRRLGEPVIRSAVGRIMSGMGAQFVLGRTMPEAIRRGEAMLRKGYSYSFDMLGEAAQTDRDALIHLDAYAGAIEEISKRVSGEDVRTNPGISVKLSALHPRYEQSQRESMLPVLRGRLLELARAARRAGIGFNIDAEECVRLELSLEVIESVLADSSLSGWDGFGVAVQAFGRGSIAVLDWLYGLAESLDRRIMVRLVKGAYWDSEIKRAQVKGLKCYPVFTCKAHSDISYLAGVRRLLGMTDRIYPQFATHNAHSAAAVLQMSGGDTQGFEFQRLHGMGESLHECLRRNTGAQCRIYAPVGEHSDLLAYLVRRLFENGAGSSFVHQIVDKSLPPEKIVCDPIKIAEDRDYAPNASIPLPCAIFAPRRNSAGLDVSDPADMAAIKAGRASFGVPYCWEARPVTVTEAGASARNIYNIDNIYNIYNPAHPQEITGSVIEADAESVSAVIDAALAAQPAWESVGVGIRADMLRRLADLYEDSFFEFLALAAREAGKTLSDGVAEIREAVDFLRFYADEGERSGDIIPARGVVICISPWNFPLAIFTGQIAAALVAGNAVVAKPAEQTPLIAARAMSLMLEAGIPLGVVQFLPGSGDVVGAALAADPRIGGVCFTGSLEVAKRIDRQLARTAPDARLIAETGGLNAMLVDSTALPEQAVRDIIRSAFQSAGQRCSSLRILYLQKDVAGTIMTMLEGAMDTLVVGDPWSPATDIGPVIDEQACGMIGAYCRDQEHKGRLIKRLNVADRGLFVPPTLLRVGGIKEVEREIFGPVLHVAFFEEAEIDKVAQEVNASGYGLTFGLHTRIDRRAQRLIDTVRTGNIYVNRDQIGAVVGSQPFGGRGLSGTGPKAGGPLYVPALRRERSAQRPGRVRKGAPVAREMLERVLGALEIDEEQRKAHKAPERMEMLREALGGRARAALSASAGLDFEPVDLPGPTGESNRYFLASRGVVLCLGPDRAALLDQVTQALAAGNIVLAVAPGASGHLVFLRGTALPLAVVDGVCNAEALSGLELEAVAFCGGTAARAETRRILACRDGEIVPLITERIAASAYCSEYSVCIDSTATGGDALLLSEAAAHRCR